MLQPPVSLSQETDSYVAKSLSAPAKPLFVAGRAPNIFFSGFQRRWGRAQRRRRVGRAYDMALEIAAVVPPNSRVLDVGCGKGFIAHHLSAMLGTNVIGIDLTTAAETSIDYRQFDGRHFPLPNESVDAVLFCYVLHHAQDLPLVVNEMRRVLSNGGLAIIYEDIPAAWWDRMVCVIHDLKWRKRSGPCTFHGEAGWRSIFNSEGFEIVTERPLSRWRNLSHPVRRRFYILRCQTRSA
jgi:SAM-dependent methyltransferase